MWSKASSKNVNIAYDTDLVELKIPLKDISTTSQKPSFFVVETMKDFIAEVYPQDILIKFD